MHQFIRSGPQVVTFLLNGP